MDLRLETLLTFSSLKENPNSQMFSLKHYRLTAKDLEHFKVGDSVRIVNPMLSFNYNEAVILDVLAKIGWKQSNDTGNHSSNCQINDLGIKAHIKKYGFHPYEQELAEQVRCGNLDRMEAIKKILSPLDTKRIASVEKVLRQNE